MSEPSCRMLEWDSAFFGRRIAALTANRLTEAECRTALAWCDAHAVDCLYFLADPDDFTTCRTVSAHAFELVDVRLELARTVAPPDGGAPLGDIRPAHEHDIPALAAIAADAHRDTRFAFDPRFPPERVRELYRVWIARSCRDFADGVLVAERNGQPAGYVTMHLEEGDGGRIGLVGVATQWRGQRIGSALVHAALAWFGTRGRGRVRVTTQARNVAGVRTYERAGFLLARAGLWHHRWFDRPAPVA